VAELVEQTRAARDAFLDALVFDDPVQLYERAPCGYLSTTPDGLIVKCNATLRTWLDLDAADLVGKLSFVDLLSRGDRIFHETHYAPSLRMHGSVREIALDLVRRDGRRLPVLVNATLDRDEEGHPRVIRIAVFEATERRRYERELLRAKEAAEDAERHARRLARTLQQTLIPPELPTIPGLELAAAYRPAGDGSVVGGDFYDVFSLGPTDWIVVIGDVCGKGVEAAALTALVRHTVRALAVGYDGPARMLAGLDEVLLRQSGERFCTVALLRVRQVDGEWCVVHATGGHCAPLLLGPDRPAEAVGAQGPLVGAFEGGSFGEVTVALRPGEVLLLHTDGVTEARDGNGAFYGEARLGEVLAGLPTAAEPVVDGLVADVLAFQDQWARDDIAVVALGVPGPA
jgi:sigma-B regulation protein RsbU (phosphoserine phosphatase)